MAYVWQRWMATEFRAAGLKVIEVEGWENRGRPASTGHYDPDEGVTNHHTGSTSSPSNPGPTLRTLIAGRPDLPGPLAPWSVRYDGTVVVIAAGRCNHAGAVGKRVPFAALGADGNAIFMGDEVDTNGTQTLPAAQRHAIAVTNAVYLEHMNRGPDRVHRHADISGTGKWDIGNISTAALRSEAKRALKQLRKPPKPKPETLRVVTYNAGNASDVRFAADLDRLAAIADVIFLQEVGDRGAVLARFDDSTDWLVHRGESEGRGKVAVLIRPRPGLVVTARGYERCAGRTFVGSWGAGPPTIDAKWIAWLRIRLNGRRIHVGSTHLVPSVERDPKSADGKRGRARRLAMYARHILAVRLWARGRGGAHIVGGDFNATPAFRPLRVLLAAGMRVARAASHGKRDIDQQWRRARRLRPWLLVSGVRGLSGYSSDHRPVLVTYVVKPKRKSKEK